MLRNQKNFERREKRKETKKRKFRSRARRSSVPQLKASLSSLAKGGTKKNKRELREDR
jgi:hypothetical protein